jgi:hypothetical protein
MTKILIILVALCANALASPTPSASPSTDFTPMVDWRCTIDVTTDRIVLVDAKTGDYLSSASLSTVLPPASGAQSGQDHSPTPDQLCRAAVTFSRTVIDKITPPDNTFIPRIEGGYTYADGHFETIVQVGQKGGQVGPDPALSFESQVVAQAQSVFASKLTDALSPDVQKALVPPTSPASREAFIQAWMRTMKLASAANGYLKMVPQFRQDILHAGWGSSAEKQTILEKLDKIDACAVASVDYDKAVTAFAESKEKSEVEFQRILTARKRLVNSMAALK